MWLTRVKNSDFFIVEGLNRACKSKNGDFLMIHSLYIAQATGNVNVQT